MTFNFDGDLVGNITLGVILALAIIALIRLLVGAFGDK